MDLHEDREKNQVTAVFEFPGAAKEDIQIDVQGGKLTVSAETKQSTELNESGYAVRERHFGKFARTLQLPQGVKACFSNNRSLRGIANKTLLQDEEIKASMEHGVLTVTFPKTAPELAARRISIA